MLPMLPDDVISEILSWVPVKPACRFQCVSRGWRTLISSTAFLAVHKSRADPLLLSFTTSLLAGKVNSVSRLMDIEGNILRVNKKPDLWTINHCFNGPVCVCSTAHNLSVVDLATGNMVMTSIELNYELLCSLGVGCAVPSRSYKVVCLTSKNDPCKVLTLEDGAKWRQVQPPPTPSYVTHGINHSSPVTVNGVMHFLNKFVITHVDEDYVLRFDLESEEWKASIEGPARSGDKLQRYKYLVKLNDVLCMIQWNSLNQCLIWVLTDSAKGTWVNEYTIPMAPTFGSLRPLTFMRDGRNLLFYASNRLKTTPTLQVYDPFTRTYTQLTKLTSNPFANSGVCALHLEYFVSPKILPTPSMLSQLVSCQWLRRLNPLSLFFK